MEKLKMPQTSANSGLPVSRPSQGVARRNPNDPLPKILNRLTDVDIPRSSWSAWIPAGGAARTLRRELTEVERQALQIRFNELAPVVAGYDGPRDQAIVVSAIAGMLGAYRSMRQVGDSAVAQLESISQALASFPAWAIQKACGSIQTNGVWRDGKFDRNWPPNDSEIVDAVRKEVKLYADSLRSAAALLSAEVDPDA